MSFIIMEHETPYLKYDLQFFADEGGEKTEEPTAKKLRNAREEGKVAKSTDITTAFTLLALFLILKYFVGYMGIQFMQVFRLFFNNIPIVTKEGLDRNYAMALMREGMIRILVISLPMLLAAFMVGIVSNVSQVKWQVTLKPLQPKFSNFNPINGMKQIFSKSKVFELIKSVAKLSVLAYVVYVELRNQWGMLINFYDLGLNSALALIGDVITNLGIRISLIFLVIAIVDLVYQKRKFKKDMKMTKQEVKDEHKQSEGDPKIKSQIRQRMVQASQRRMMQALPEADVVITNPTHLAVAVRYKREEDNAPVIIAKGAGYLAEKIKQTAREHEIAIVENKPLARMLYYNVELGMEIPPELYQMVAEILAYVYNVKGKAS